MGKLEKISDEMMESVSGGTLTQEEALGCALRHANIKRDQVDFIKKVELDCENGRRIYDVRFYEGGFAYEYDIDAENGEILKFEKE